MDQLIFWSLLADGLARGAIYGFMALALVLVFTTTRVLLIPLGDFAALSGLTAASLLAGRAPLSALLCAAALLVLARHKKTRGLVFTFLAALAFGLWAFIHLGGHSLPYAAALVLSVLLVTPLGAALYEVAFASTERATILHLLILGIAAHYGFQGLGVLGWGGDVYRIPFLLTGSLTVGSIAVPYQQLALLLAGVFLSMAFVGMFRTLWGKQLLAAAQSEVGSLLVGISRTKVGVQVFTLGAIVGAVGGLMSSPLTGAYYDMGFELALKAFVAAVIAGLDSYPWAFAAGIGVGIAESFSSFYASAYKEVIVYCLILPALLVRNAFAAYQPAE